MKKRMLAVILSTAMAASLGAMTIPVYAEEGEPYKAALLLNGTLGDKSFYDSANEGLTKLQEELGEDKQNGSPLFMTTAMTVLMM